jgi:virulence-associated protein VapD
MAHYAIAFDMDTKGMTAAGLSRSQITRVYQKEIPKALASCGFTAHPQGSLYHTEAEQNPITAIMQLQSTLKRDATSFCKHVRRVHVFRMEEWSDVTELIADRPAGPTLTEEEEAEQELEQQEFINEATASAPAV